MRLPTLVGCGLIVALVAGCTPTVARARSTPVVVAPFASEEEALAAATEAYARYVDVLDTIGRDGGLHADRLAEVAVDPQLALELAGFEAFQAAGKRITGRTIVRDAVFQQITGVVRGELLVYLCEDISGIALFGPTRGSLDSPQRPDTNYFLVTLVFVRERLWVSSIERWDNREC